MTKKDFLEYINSKRRSKENIGLILDESTHLLNRAEVKAKVFNAFFFFSLVFNSNCRPWAAWSTELEDHDYGNCDFWFVDAKIVKGQSYQLNVHKSMQAGGICLKVLKELADVIAGCVSIIYEKSLESGEVSTAWKLDSAIPL